MVDTAYKDDPSFSINARAHLLLKETKALQIVKSANILIDLFGIEKAFKRIKPKREGKLIQMEFPAINNSIHFALTSIKADFRCKFGPPAGEPAAIITMNVKTEKMLKTISDIISLKDSLFGLMKIVPKLLTRKLKIKGSLFTAIMLCRCLMIGKHELYKGQL